MDEDIIVEYDPRWSLLFEEEAARIREVLDENLVTCIEHFGSTAVPEMAIMAVSDGPAKSAAQKWHQQSEVVRISSSVSGRSIVFGAERS